MKSLIKLFTGLGALVILIVGLALLLLTGYGFINSSIFLGDDSTKNLVLGIMLTVGLTVVAGAAGGLYGICTEKAKLVCIFQIIMILFMIIFLGVGIGLVILPTQFFNGDCKTSTNVVIEYADKIYTSSQDNYCINCPCALDNSTANLNSKYSLNEIDYINRTYTNISSSGSHSSEQCLKDQGGLNPA